ncbi:MAG: hypothetical protein GY865_00720, partial [candidate division Zixibacteria bacterium]|nr:hypothetical protein [candidate division Zixibacteria bacterium]
VHETAESKDGKPFRVVVDIFPAIHDLGQKDFVELPKSLLTSIRTSQYSVEPEKVVRIVCDLDQTVMYRVEKKGNSVYLYLPDKNNGSFASWSSPLKITKPVKAPVVLTKVANNTSNDKKEEPAKKVVKKKVVKKVPKVVSQPVKTEKKGTTTLVKHFQTKSSDSIDHDKFLSTQKSLPKTKVVAAAPTPKPVPVKKAKTSKKVEVVKAKVEKKEPVANKEIVKVDPPKAKPKSGQPAQEFTMVKKTAPVKTEPKKKAIKTAPVVKKPVVKTKEVASTEVKAVEKSTDKQKPTSRFRRKPTFPAKLKGTIVAEFPTRIVMKYRPGTGRDPFDNLLTDTKGTDSPIQKKIPDVETAKLVGVLESSDGKKSALLEDHDGYGYILKSGDKIKKGYVGKIYSDKAYFKLFEYGWSRTVALYMSIN